MDHLLNCTEQLFGGGDSGKSAEVSAESDRVTGKVAQTCGKRLREPQREASSSSDGGKCSCKNFYLNAST